MVNYAFDLGIWTILFFIIGMYKPQWPLFFLKKPDRFMIIVITTILVMITFTLYGEGTRRAKLEQATKLPVPQSAVPVPVPVPETPVKK
jgi:TRAP-type mannitol/chloroaromatic compound transport system permease large subunit